MKILLGFGLLAIILAMVEGRGSRSKHFMDAKAGNSSADSNDRSGKLFSLFNIVTFSNGPCTSNAAVSSTSGAVFRNGTCLTSTECTNQNGQISGNCAAAFGVCCVFITSTSGGTVNQNCSYIQSPGFPAATTATNTLTFNVNKCSNDVCDLRLDFETFQTSASTATTEVDGGACADTLTIATPANQNIPTICGSNTGDHIYVNLGNQNSDSATLTFAFTGTGVNRMFDIKVTQVKCGTYDNPPDTCLQYLTGTTGRIQSFNFDATTGTTHLANQDYNVCIRQETGFCCIQYTVCANDANPFSLITAADMMGTSLIDSQCSEDFVVIDSAQAMCNQGNTGIGPLTSKFCGTNLNTITGLMTNVPICDCSQPFSVGIFTDNTADPADGTVNTNAMMLSRGVCLEYMQIPCSG